MRTKGYRRREEIFDSAEPRSRNLLYNGKKGAALIASWEGRLRRGHNRGAP